MEYIEGKYPKAALAILREMAVVRLAEKSGYSECPPEELPLLRDSAKRGSQRPIWTDWRLNEGKASRSRSPGGRARRSICGLTATPSAMGTYAVTRHSDRRRDRSCSR
jgi:hypothetical protein